MHQASGLPALVFAAPPPRPPAAPPAAFTGGPIEVPEGRPGLAAVQRAAGDEAQAPAPTATSAAASTGGPPEAGPTEAPPAVDVDAMARQVYQILCRRLRVEQERARGTSR